MKSTIVKYSKIIFLIWISVALLSLICLLLLGGFKLMFFIGLILWLVYFFIFKKYTQGVIPLVGIIGVFIFFLVASLTLIFISVPHSDSPSNEPTSKTPANTDQKMPSASCELVSYAGKYTNMYSFKYPKCYTIDENERSTWINNDKTPKYDDHIVITWFDGPTTPSSCQNYAGEGEEAVYAKKTTLAGLEGCESSVRKMKTGSPDKFTLVIWELKAPNRSWTIVAWARTEADMNKFRDIASSIVLK